MAYFDGLTAALFKTTQQGQILFFPSGSRGRGFVVPSAERAAAIRRYIVTSYAIVLVAIIIMPIGGMQSSWSLTISAALAALFLLWYYAWAVPRLTVGLPRADERLAYREAFQATANAYGRTTLIVLSVICALFLCSSIWLSTQPDQRMTAWVGIVLFGFGTLQSIYMIYTRRP